MDVTTWILAILIVVLIGLTVQTLLLLFLVVSRSGIFGRGDTPGGGGSSSGEGDFARKVDVDQIKIALAEMSLRLEKIETQLKGQDK